MSADDEFSLHVNAKLAGQGKGHASVQEMEVKSLLRPGQNVLAVSAANAATAPAAQNPAGLIGVLRIQFDQGDPLTIVTDGNWLVSKDAPGGWQEADFAATGWAAAKDLGAHGMRPWGNVNGSAKRPASRSTVFTQSKDGRFVYAIMKTWPGQELVSGSFRPRPGSRVTLLGYDKPLEWTWQDSQTTVFFPEDLQDESRRPGEHAWVLKVERAADGESGG
jgi:hypothetical protein